MIWFVFEICASQKTQNTVNFHCILRCSQISQFLVLELCSLHTRVHRSQAAKLAQRNICSACIYSLICSDEMSMHTTCAFKPIILFVGAVLCCKVGVLVSVARAILSLFHAADSESVSVRDDRQSDVQQLQLQCKDDSFIGTTDTQQTRLCPLFIPCMYAWRREMCLDNDLNRPTAAAAAGL